MKTNKIIKNNINTYQSVCPSFNNQYNPLLKVASQSKENLDYSEILQPILNAIEIGIIVIKQDELIIYYNYKFLEIWQLQEPLLEVEKISGFIIFLFNKLKKESVKSPRKNLNSSLYWDNFDPVLELKDGRFVEQSSQIIKLSEKEIGRVWMFRDVTHQKNIEEELRQVLEQEKEASQIKTRFVSMISHEFRTPLNIISFSNSLLKRHAAHWTEEKMHSYFSRIQMAVDQINYLMDTILFIGRAELGKLTFTPQVTDLNQFCINLIKEFENNESNHILTYKSFEAELLVSFDKKLIYIVLSNLISNAFKYSRLKSEIEVSLSYKEQTILLQVKDQGIGIPSQDQQHLFEAFYRGSNINTSRIKIF